MKWYCLGIHHCRDWLSWGSSKQLLKEWPEDFCNCSWWSAGASFPFPATRKWEAQSVAVKLVISRSSAPAAGLGRHLAGSTLLAGQPSQGQKPLHTRRHIRTRGRGCSHRAGGVPHRGGAGGGLHVSSSSSAPLQKKRRTSEFRHHKTEAHLSADSRHRLCRQSPLDSSPHPTTAGTAASGMLLHLHVLISLFGCRDNDDNETYFQVTGGINKKIQVKCLCLVHNRWIAI